MSLADELREILSKEERWEIIYNKINGEYVLELCEEVRDECEEGGVLGPLIGEMYRARSRIAKRLGTDPALDDDLVLMTDKLEDYARACGKLMYHYGYQDGKNGI